MEPEKVKAIKENVGAVGGLGGAGLAAFVMFMANAQDAKIETNADNIKEVRTEVSAVKDDVNNANVGLQTDMATVKTNQEHILDAIKEIKDKLE